MVKDLAPGVDPLRRHLSAATTSGAKASVRWQSRPWMRNYMWGGKETNRVGTHEFVDFCRRVGAEPFYCVNFLSDGRSEYSRPGTATAPATPRRPPTGSPTPTTRTTRSARATASPQPYNLKLWQLGNETSYGETGFQQGPSHRHYDRVRQGHAAARPLDPAHRLGRLGTGAPGANSGRPTWRSAPGINSTTSPST